MGSGVVLLPSAIEMITRKRVHPLGPHGDLYGLFGGGSRDPFERRANGLLLAEDFARLPLSSKPKGLAALAAWVEQNGPLNPIALYGGEPAADRPMLASSYGPTIGFQDHFSDWWLEQMKVACFMGALVALSSANGDSGVVRPVDWEDAVFATEDSAYSAGNFSLGRIRDWDDAVRWQALVLNPFVELAMQPEVRTGWLAHASEGSNGYGIMAGPGVEDDDDPAEADGMLGWPPRQRRPAPALPLRPEVVYRWRTILAPIYLQLYEALRRISEGKMGAVLCRGCGKPTLILDGRKTSFCKPSEGNAYKQRAFRARNDGKPQPSRLTRMVSHGNITGPAGLMSGWLGPDILPVESPDDSPDIRRGPGSS
jgi:hypothetical protein